MKFRAAAALTLFLAQHVHSEFLSLLGPQGVNLAKLQPPEPKLTVQDGSIPLNRPLEAEFPGHWFRQPLDHFDKSNHHTFRQRYWINTRHYRPRTGAPVIVLDGGETDGAVCYNRNLASVLTGIRAGFPISTLALSTSWPRLQVVLVLYSNIDIMVSI